MHTTPQPLFFHLTSPPPPTHTIPQPLFFQPTSPSPHTHPTPQPTQCNQDYCSIHMPLCPKVNDQGDMNRGGNSLDRPIIIHLEIHYLMQTCMSMRFNSDICVRAYVQYLNNLFQLRFDCM